MNNPVVIEDVAGEIADEKGLMTELSKQDQDFVKMNYQFYDR